MLTLLHGTDGYRLELAIKEMVASRRGKPNPAIQEVRVDCNEDTAAEALERHLKYPSFFGDTTLIIAKNAACELIAEVISDHSVASLADVELITVQDTSAKGFDKKILATLQKIAATSSEYDRLTGAQLVAWVRTTCTNAGGSIDAPTASALIKRVGEDSRILASELEKLSAYAGREPISLSMLSMLCASRPERDEWELSNAVASHDKRAIVGALWRKVQEGTPDQLLIGSVAAGLRNLIMVRDLTDRRYASAEIAKTTGLHPFVVSKTLRGAKATDITRLTRSHEALALLDRNSKGGLVDATDGLFDVVLGL